MSNFGRKMSTPGWCTFALLGGALALAFGAFAGATPQDKSEGTLVPAAQQPASTSLVDQAAAIDGKAKAASSKKTSSPTTLSGVQAGSNDQPHEDQLSAMPGASHGSKFSSLENDVTRTAQGGLNNLCASPETIGDGGTFYNTVGNTTDGTLHLACKFDGQTYHDDWFDYQATCDGEVTAATCDNADYDTDIVMYDGHVGDWLCPPTDADMLGCNDDGPGCAGFSSSLTVGPVVTGQWLTIRVGGWNDGDQGTATLTMSCAGVTECGDGNCDPDENSCSCQADCPGECACTLFDNKAEFEAFNAKEGKTLKGIEDFEEGILPPAAVDGLDDPLCGGVPNLPDAFPYPNGLDQLNMCLQSNTLGAAPVVPAPQGLNGLAAASAGFLGIVSDVVLSNTFVNGYDIMFTSPPVTPGEEDLHTGVGFNPIASLGGASVDIQVFDAGNVLLASASAPSSENASTFWGIWCVDPIGRINIFDPGNGAEGADNIQLWIEIPGDCGANGCEDGEDPCNCPQDCGPEECGNGICCSGAGEDCESCAADCDPCPFCGDGDVNQPEEDCDPPGSLCANGEFCLPDCTCPGLGNDLCADRVPIFDGDTPYDTTGASTDGPQHGPDGPCEFDGQTYHDIWFNYTATCTGDLTLSTCDQADYDTDLVAYDGCDCDNLVLLGCNDDGAGCAGFSSHLVVPVIENNCYKVRVGGWNDGDQGTAILTVSCFTPPDCDNGKCEEGEDECSCPEDCPGECACFFFNDKAEFEAFNEEDGKTFKGLEDFEEGTLPVASVDGLDDPLCGGVPNAPDAFPYPNGLDQLNLCVQSNILGAAPVDPAPQGLDGLAAASAGFLGIISDVVLSNTFVNGFDIMLVSPPVTPGEEDDHTGVGFNPIASLGGATVDIQVFNKNNVQLATASAPSSENGSTFWGVWCSDPIGRINIFDPGNGAEGADNIQLWHDVTCDPPCQAPAVCIGGSCCGDGVVEGGEECDPGGDCGPCVWDTFPIDGQVGAGDLANLLGNWGELPPDANPLLVCLIADDDNNIGPLELANLLGNWGLCPPPLDGDDGECSHEDCLENCQCVGLGACCGVKGDPGACDADVTADECAAAGGDYAGDDTTCDDCPNPACVDAEGSCSEPHGLPGCENPVCCAIVCDVDPACCEGWDEICVDEAADLCVVSCGDGFCEGGESACNCAADCEGECACNIFTSQAEFEAFNQEEGKALKGVEDFEEGTLPPNSVAGMDDPLCGGIPSLPPGSPYPAGLDQLNMCVQSNILGEFPATPAPAGLNGLAAASTGFGGALSDVVVSNTFVNSLDMMFTSPPAQEEDDHTGIGFNTITLLGGASVHIQVFNKANQFLVGALNVPVVGDSSFWGVWCADPIGRINVFDPGNGAEGGDNIQLWVQGVGFCGDNKCTAGEDCENCPEDCGACPVCGNGVIEEGEECDPPGPDGCGGEVCLPDCTCGDLCGDGICSAGENSCNCSADCPGVCEIAEFTNEAAFVAAAEAAGKVLRGTEDFEEGTLPPAAVDGMDDPLCSGIPNAPDAFPYPLGLTGTDNLCLQSNIGGADPSVPNPQGIDGLAAASAGFLGAVSDVVLSNTFVNGLDLIFDDPKTAVGFEVLDFLGVGTVAIKVYDTANVEILSTTSPGDAAGTSFWGVVSGTPIGRINIFDVVGAEGGDRIQLWEQP